MKGELVPFELALKLKEKGYPQNFSRRKSIIAPSYHYYNSKGLVDGAVDDDGFVAYASAPLIFQVLKWLREEKNIHIAVDIMKAYPAGNLIYWGYNIVLVDKYEVYHHDWNSDPYEEAALSGIEYVLDNLI